MHAPVLWALYAPMRIVFIPGVTSLFCMLASITVMSSLSEPGVIEFGESSFILASFLQLTSGLLSLFSVVAWLKYLVQGRVKTYRAYLSVLPSLPVLIFLGFVMWLPWFH